MTHDRLLAEATEFVKNLFRSAPPSDNDERWRRRADAYIAAWVEHKKRDPEGLGWHRSTLLGRVIDGLQSIGLPIEQHETEIERRARFVEQALAGMWAFGAGEPAAAFQLYHLNDQLPIQAQARLMGLSERKYHEARKVAYNCLRWEVFKFEGKGCPVPDALETECENTLN